MPSDPPETTDLHEGFAKIHALLEVMAEKAASEGDMTRDRLDAAGRP